MCSAELSFLNGSCLCQRRQGQTDTASLTGMSVFIRSEACVCVSERVCVYGMIDFSFAVAAA